MTPMLLIIDMQEDFFTDQTRLQAHRAALIENINALAATAREYAVPVVWVQTCYRPDMSDANRYLREHNITMLVEGTPGAALLDGLQPAPGDLHLTKKRYSAFFGTPILDLLRDHSADTVIVAGINTHACVRSTAVDAYQHDYAVIFATDGINSYDGEHHDVSLRYMDGKIGEMLTNKAIRERLAQ